MPIDDALFTVTAAELLSWITIINIVLVVIIGAFGILGWYRVNARITRMNARISLTQTQVTDRSMILAQSLTELAKSLAGKDRTKQDDPKSAETKSDVIVPLNPGNQHRP